MKTTYLDEFESLLNTKIAYIPIGTIEWHGNYLPLETDFLIAENLCQKVSEEIVGYVLPPIYMGGYGSDLVDGVLMRGMDRKLKKKLLGNIFFLDSETLIKLLKSIVKNLQDQGFSKIIVLTGHGGSGQKLALNKVFEEERVLVVDPYDEVKAHHADEGEISILWACSHGEESRARSMPKDKDLIEYYGYDPIEKASLELGDKYRNIMIKATINKIEEFVRDAI
jgi:creatinine amidohydrolase